MAQTGAFRLSFCTFFIADFSTSFTERSANKLHFNSLISNFLDVDSKTPLLSKSISLSLFVVANDCVTLLSNGFPLCVPSSACLAEIFARLTVRSSRDTERFVA